MKYLSAGHWLVTENCRGIIVLIGLKINVRCSALLADERDVKERFA